MPVVWVVSEGIAGTENQCLAVAARLHVTPVVKRVRLKGLWRILSPYLGLECRTSFDDPDTLLTPPWPDIVIGAGRKAIAAMRYIAAKAPHRPVLVYLQDPRVRYAIFDVVAVPYHDAIMRPALTQRPNVIITHAAPNRVTDAVLATAKTAWAKTFAGLPSPRVAVLIGGDSRDYVMDEQAVQTLTRDLLTLAKAGTGLMITLSRRTPAAMAAKITDAVAPYANAFTWDGTGENAFHGMLAWADYICVTEESASMLSDAGTTGKPVYILPLTLRPNKAASRIKALHKKIIADGIARPFTGHLDPVWTYTKLDDATMIAEHIRGLLNTRGFTLPLSPLM
ncbi:MAG: mitochondrial fission ELM1 family protein [Pseudomonadota bacterium]